MKLKSKNLRKSVSLIMAVLFGFTNLFQSGYAVAFKKTPNGLRGATFFEEEIYLDVLKLLNRPLSLEDDASEIMTDMDVYELETTPESYRDILKENLTGYKFKGFKRTPNFAVSCPDQKLVSIIKEIKRNLGYLRIQQLRFLPGTKANKEFLKLRKTTQEAFYRIYMDESANYTALAIGAMSDEISNYLKYLNDIQLRNEVINYGKSKKDKETKLAILKRKLINSLLNIKNASNEYLYERDLLKVAVNQNGKETDRQELYKLRTKILGVTPAETALKKTAKEFGTDVNTVKQYAVAPIWWRGAGGKFVKIVKEADDSIKLHFNMEAVNEMPEETRKKIYRQSVNLLTEKKEERATMLQVMEYIAKQKGKIKEFSAMLHFNKSLSVYAEMQDGKNKVKIGAYTTGAPKLGMVKKTIVSASGIVADVNTLGEVGRQYAMSVTKQNGKNKTQKIFTGNSEDIYNVEHKMDFATGKVVKNTYLERIGEDGKVVFNHKVDTETVNPAHYFIGSTAYNGYLETVDTGANVISALTNGGAGAFAYLMGNKDFARQLFANAKADVMYSRFMSYIGQKMMKGDMDAYHASLAAMGINRINTFHNVTQRMDGSAWAVPAAMGMNTLLLALDFPAFDAPMALGMKFAHKIAKFTVKQRSVGTLVMDYAKKVRNSRVFTALDKSGIAVMNWGKDLVTNPGQTINGSVNWIKKKTGKVFQYIDGKLTKVADKLPSLGGRQPAYAHQTAGNRGNVNRHGNGHYKKGDYVDRSGSGLGEKGGNRSNVKVEDVEEGPGIIWDDATLAESKLREQICDELNKLPSNTSNTALNLSNRIHGNKSAQFLEDLKQVNASKMKFDDFVSKWDDLSTKIQGRPAKPGPKKGGNRSNVKVEGQPTETQLRVRDSIYEKIGKEKSLLFDRLYTDNKTLLKFTLDKLDDELINIRKIGNISDKNTAYKKLLNDLVDFRKGKIDINTFLSRRIMDKQIKSILKQLGITPKQAMNVRFVYIKPSSPYFSEIADMFPLAKIETGQYFTKNGKVVKSIAQKNKYIDTSFYFNNEFILGFDTPPAPKPTVTTSPMAVGDGKTLVIRPKKTAPTGRVKTKTAAGSTKTLSARAKKKWIAENITPILDGDTIRVYLPEYLLDDAKTVDNLVEIRDIILRKKEIMRMTPAELESAGAPFINFYGDLQNAKTMSDLDALVPRTKAKPAVTTSPMARPKKALVVKPGKTAGKTGAKRKPLDTPIEIISRTPLSKVPQASSFEGNFQGFYDECVKFLKNCKKNGSSQKDIDSILKIIDQYSPNNWKNYPDIGMESLEQSVLNFVTDQNNLYDSFIVNPKVFAMAGGKKPVIVSRTQNNLNELAKVAKPKNFKAMSVDDAFKYYSEELDALKSEGLSGEPLANARNQINKAKNIKNPSAAKKNMHDSVNRVVLDHNRGISRKSSNPTVKSMPVKKISKKRILLDSIPKQRSNMSLKEVYDTYIRFISKKFPKHGVPTNDILDLKRILLKCKSDYADLPAQGKRALEIQLNDFVTSHNSGIGSEYYLKTVKDISKSAAPPPNAKKILERGKASKSEVVQPSVKPAPVAMKEIPNIPVFEENVAVRTIHGEYTKYADDLAKYGVSTADISELKTRLGYRYTGFKEGKINGQAAKIKMRDDVTALVTKHNQAINPELVPYRVTQPAKWPTDTIYPTKNPKHQPTIKNYGVKTEILPQPPTVDGLDLQTVLNRYNTYLDGMVEQNFITREVAGQTKSQLAKTAKEYVTIPELGKNELQRQLVDFVGREDKLLSSLQKVNPKGIDKVGKPVTKVITDSPYERTGVEPPTPAAVDDAVKTAPTAKAAAHSFDKKTLALLKDLGYKNSANALKVEKVLLSKSSHGTIHPQIQKAFPNAEIYVVDNITAIPPNTVLDDYLVVGFNHFSLKHGGDMTKALNQGKKGIALVKTGAKISEPDIFATVYAYYDTEYVSSINKASKMLGQYDIVYGFEAFSLK